MKTFAKLMVAYILIITASCTKISDTGISLSLKGTTNLPAARKGLNVEGFTFTKALLGIREIEIKMEDEMFDDDDSEFEFEGNYVVDLLAGTSTPAFGLAELPPGTYNKFESETANILEGAKSLILIGTYTDANGTEYGFEFSTPSEIEFEFESDSGLVLTEGTVLDMLISINLPMFFAGVDFSKATKNENDIIVINELSNTSIAEAIKNNIDHVAEMEDENEHESEHD